MRKPSEMYAASRMQNMVQIRTQNPCLATKLHFIYLGGYNYFGALGVENPHGGAMLHDDSHQSEVSLQLGGQGGILLTRL